MHKILKSLTAALTLTLFTATLVVPPVALTGCASLDNPETFAELLLDLEDISRAGTIAALVANESNRTALEKTRDALKGLEKLPDGTLKGSDLTEALANLPIEQLQSPKGQIYISLGKPILRRALRSVNLGESDKIKLIGNSMQIGMTGGLSTVVKPK